MNQALVILAAVTVIGTAVLTTASVAKLLVSPITSAVQRLESAVSGLRTSLEESEAQHHKDIKEIWRYLASKE